MVLKNIPRGKSSKVSFELFQLQRAEAEEARAQLLHNGFIFHLMDHFYFPYNFLKHKHKAVVKINFSVTKPATTVEQCQEKSRKELSNIILQIKPRFL